MAIYEFKFMNIRLVITYKKYYDSQIYLLKSKLPLRNCGTLFSSRQMKIMVCSRPPGIQKHCNRSLIFTSLQRIYLFSKTATERNELLQ